MMASGTPRADCCLKASLWEGTPTGAETTLPGVPNPTYVSQPTSPSRVAILLVHDIFGWTFLNNRLLTDAYAREANATVYLPDFFGGEVVTMEGFNKLDLPGFLKRNARSVREPEILAYARALRASGQYDKIGAIGFCYGGWAVFRLGAEEFVDPASGRPLVDAISTGHPSLLTEKDVEELSVLVPAQLIAPEFDHVYTPEMKHFTFTTLLKRNVPFEYQHLPGVEHGCLVRGDANKNGERAAMVRGKNAAVTWFKQWLHE
jgi:dienelactone hydrolase